MRLLNFLICSSSFPSAAIPCRLLPSPVMSSPNRQKNECFEPHLKKLGHVLSLTKPTIEDFSTPQSPPSLLAFSVSKPPSTSPSISDILLLPCTFYFSPVCFRYFDINLISSITLYKFMAKYNCKKLVFSSSTTVYGQLKKIPCVEDFELKAMNPYGRKKLFLEEIARDIHNADWEWKIILLTSLVASFFD
ncbi:hypothetical protein Lser_V15G19324 [Lactuca serriola]